MIFIRYFICWVLFVACQATSDPSALAPGPVPPGIGHKTCAPQPATRPGVTKILFVGNSLTYTNDLPAKVAAIGSDRGVLIEKEMLAYPNYALEDHWNEGCLQTMISSGYFDFVVIQQGPSSQADGAQSLLDFGQRIQDLCKASDTKLAFFMVWPARIYYNTFPGVIANYTTAASSTRALLCPVGQIWKLYQDRTGDFSYYGPDEFHPSLKGTDVSAEVIYKTLFP
ncbi:MAG: SGNH/GDSL hydrolase family protein [Cyclobacteriaceae bacterium]|nr:SGNH/GDSL hydrolase family protein [Cyclobacteriaceae bacterium]